MPAAELTWVLIGAALVQAPVEGEYVEIRIGSSLDGRFMRRKIREPLPRKSWHLCVVEYDRISLETCVRKRLDRCRLAVGFDGKR